VEPRRFEHRIKRGFLFGRQNTHRTALRRGPQFRRRLSVAAGFDGFSLFARPVRSAVD